MNANVSTPSQALMDWQEATARLESRVSRQPGLMHTPMRVALQATGWKRDAVSEVPGATENPLRDPAWGDWWLERQYVAAGKLSIQDIAQSSLQRLEQVGRDTAACVEVWHDQTLQAAVRCDERIAAGKPLGLLEGMPLAHKDLVLNRGRPYACGMAGPAGTADVDAAVLQGLQAAGALNMGRLHMTEIAFDPAGVNEMAGHCRNPWSSAHIPGGSSSGSGAAVAAGAVVGAIGSDTGGSIRIPSILCGVTGIKPTFGLVSRAGAMTLSHTNDHLGPMTRSARDCALMLQALAGFDPADEGSIPAPTESADYLSGLGKPVKGLRIGVAESYFTRNLHADVQAMLKRSLEQFEQMGVEIRPVPDFPYDDLNALAIMIIRAEATAVHGEMARDPAGILGQFTRSRLQEGNNIPASLYLQALALRGPLLMQFVQEVMAEVDVLLAPVFAHPTPRIEEFDALTERAQYLRGELTRLTRPINFLGLPSMALPGGFVTGDDGLRMPNGFQLIGKPYSEPLLLQMGNAFQTLPTWTKADLPMPSALPWR